MSVFIIIYEIFMDLKQSISLKKKMQYTIKKQTFNYLLCYNPYICR